MHADPKGKLHTGEADIEKKSLNINKSCRKACIVRLECTQQGAWRRPCGFAANKGRITNVTHWRTLRRKLTIWKGIKISLGSLGTSSVSFFFSQVFLLNAVHPKILHFFASGPSVVEAFSASKTDYHHGL